MPNQDLLIPKGIAIHHSATADSGTLSWGAIRNYHTKTLGWKDVGYHYGVEIAFDAAGRRHVEILHGRLPYVKGAHEPKLNATHLGVCVVGNYDLGPVPEDVWQRTVELVAWLMWEYKILHNQVVPHRQFSSKTCPGTKFDMNRFKEDINKEFSRRFL